MTKRAPTTADIAAVIREIEDKRIPLLRLGESIERHPREGGQLEAYNTVLVILQRIGPVDWYRR